MADSRSAELYTGDLAVLAPVLRRPREPQGSPSETDGGASPNIIEQVDKSKDDTEASGSEHMIHGNQGLSVGSLVNKPEADDTEGISNNNPTTQTINTEPASSPIGTVDESREDEDSLHAQHEDATEPMVRASGRSEAEEVDETIFITQNVVSDPTSGGSQSIEINPEDHQDVGAPVVKNGSFQPDTRMSTPKNNTPSQKKYESKAQLISSFLPDSFILYPYIL